VGSYSVALYRPKVGDSRLLWVVIIDVSPPFAVFSSRTSRAVSITRCVTLALSWTHRVR